MNVIHSKEFVEKIAKCWALSTNMISFLPWMHAILLWLHRKMRRHWLLQATQRTQPRIASFFSIWNENRKIMIKNIVKYEIKQFKRETFSHDSWEIREIWRATFVSVVAIFFKRRKNQPKLLLCIFVRISTEGENSCSLLLNVSSNTEQNLTNIIRVCRLYRFARNTRTHMQFFSVFSFGFCLYLVFLRLR